MQPRNHFNTLQEPMPSCRGDPVQHKERSAPRHVNVGTSRSNEFRQSTPAPWLQARGQGDFLQSFQSANSSKLAHDEITSRHVLVGGNPQEWPLFMSCFTSSTDRCGFSNEENLVRLQKCLKGSALEAVRGKLMLPDTVPDVLNTEDKRRISKRVRRRCSASFLCRYLEKTIWPSKRTHFSTKDRQLL